ncbi:hypothetical protein [Streptomyces xiamenensis]|uniref:hypothetical protein n=1 Tax=Streptomyces xiamenensis TaxID=408015 RepID=UPI0035E2F6DD
MRSARKSAMVSSIAALALSFGMATPAAAEGNWIGSGSGSGDFQIMEGEFDSYINGALPGFNSRTWTKRKSHDVDTEIQFMGCFAPEIPGVQGSRGTSVEVQLTRRRDNLPDVNTGRKTFTACFRSSSASSVGNWGTRGVGDYRFAITNLNNGRGGKLDVWLVFVDY